jgi:alkylated DNA repair dioxygenase AlkB
MRRFYKSHLKVSRRDADQCELFQHHDAERPQTLLDEAGAQVDYWPHFLPDGDWMARLQQELPWRQHQVKLFGKEVSAPRLSSWHGDEGAHYRYSGVRYQPMAWTPALAEIRAMLERQLGVPFNAVLANWYRSGQDAMGWHADDEPELGATPVIASLSLGVERDFVLRPKGKSKRRLLIGLKDRSLLVMRGHTQRDWLHALPRRTQVHDARINLTFRFIQLDWRAGMPAELLCGLRGRLQQ